ncbi:SIR2-like protein [Prosthecobacter fusiformis]|uniref:SIR2-like protein n=1 Tax=Prosthecobacter fusiformis TaxID=48464 RepID=A0A4R7SPD6_9BACT|nr:SIR2 family protein [Prosthecobacter fusiformis]TDU80774.1 SIR2-like protein [Prosthecobacter fusiformis]
MPNRIFDTARMEEMLGSIRDGRCVLFLGPQAALLPDGRPVEQALIKVAVDHLKRFAPAWVNENGEDFGSLAYLCQAVGTDQRDEIRDKLVGELAKWKKAATTGPFHNTLADLPFTLIVQVTPDPFMEIALSAKHIPPGRLAAHAYDFREPYEAGNTGTRRNLPHVGSSAEPLLYYLGGRAQNPRSIPFASEEEVNHLVALVREQPPLPLALTEALRDGGDNHRSALFVGFEFGAWQTRFLLRGLYTQVARPYRAVSTSLEQACKRAPSKEDEEFLWAAYRVVFADKAPIDFAKALRDDWTKFNQTTPPPAQTGSPVNQGKVVEFIVYHVPSDDLLLIAQSITEFWREHHPAFESYKTSKRARELVTFMSELKRLPDLLTRIRERVPTDFSASEPTFYTF